MEMGTQRIHHTKKPTQPTIMEQHQSEQEKLRSISSMVKEWKSSNDNEIYCKISWMQIRKNGKYLMDYLSRDKITDRILFFETLASLDSLLSIFKLKLFGELNFTKSFFRNIQSEFEVLCLEYNFEEGEKHQKQQEFQLYSILFLLVMLIYFSGRTQDPKLKALPLQIVNKTFMNSLISLDLQINQKNQRIIGLILAYLVKNVNLKIYGEKMLKFILNHFDKIHIPRTLYHFVYCLREIHLERQIDVKILRKYSLLQKLWKFWAETFDSRESIYLVDYINVILRKYPGLLGLLSCMEPLMDKLQNYEVINEFSIVHQGLILEVVSKIYPSLKKQARQFLIQKAFATCATFEYSLKLLNCIMSQEILRNIFEYIFPFAEEFIKICRNRQLKSVMFSLQIISWMVQKCVENNGWGMVQALREKLEVTLEELKQYHVCRVDIARIEAWFRQMISIQYSTLC